MGKFEVTMTVEITRVVVEANNEKEALENVDVSDMVYEIKNYSIDFDLKAKEI